MYVELVDESSSTPYGARGQSSLQVAAELLPGQAELSLHHPTRTRRTRMELLREQLMARWRIQEELDNDPLYNSRISNMEQPHTAMDGTPVRAAPSEEVTHSRAAQIMGAPTTIRTGLTREEMAHLYDSLTSETSYILTTTPKDTVPSLTYPNTPEERVYDREYPAGGGLDYRVVTPPSNARQAWQNQHHGPTEGSPDLVTLSQRITNFLCRRPLVADIQRTSLQHMTDLPVEASRRPSSRNRVHPAIEAPLSTETTTFYTLHADSPTTRPSGLLRIPRSHRDSTGSANSQRLLIGHARSVRPRILNRKWCKLVCYVLLAFVGILTVVCLGYLLFLIVSRVENGEKPQHKSSVLVVKDEVDISVRVVNVKFVAAMGDNTSSVYMSFSRMFCAEVEYQLTVEQQFNDDVSCQVTRLSSGSVIVDFHVELAPNEMNLKLDEKTIRDIFNSTDYDTKCTQSACYEVDPQSVSIKWQNVVSKPAVNGINNQIATSSPKTTLPLTTLDINSASTTVILIVPPVDSLDPTADQTRPVKQLPPGAAGTIGTIVNTASTTRPTGATQASAAQSGTETKPSPTKPGIVGQVSWAHPWTTPRSTTEIISTTLDSSQAGNTGSQGSTLPTGTRQQPTKWTTPTSTESATNPTVVSKPGSSRPSGTGVVSSTTTAYTGPSSTVSSLNPASTVLSTQAKSTVNPSKPNSGSFLPTSQRSSLSHLPTSTASVRTSGLQSSKGATRQTSTMSIVTHRSQPQGTTTGTVGPTSQTVNSTGSVSLTKNTNTRSTIPTSQRTTRGLTTISQAIISSVSTLSIVGGSSARSVFDSTRQSRPWTGLRTTPMTVTRRTLPWGSTSRSTMNTISPRTSPGPHSTPFTPRTSATRRTTRGPSSSNGTSGLKSSTIEPWTSLRQTTRVTFTKGFPVTSDPHNRGTTRYTTMLFPTFDFRTSTTPMTTKRRTKQYLDFGFGRSRTTMRSTRASVPHRDVPAPTVGPTSRSTEMATSSESTEITTQPTIGSKYPQTFTQRTLINNDTKSTLNRQRTPPVTQPTVPLHKADRGIAIRSTIPWAVFHRSTSPVRWMPVTPRVHLPPWTGRTTPRQSKRLYTLPFVIQRTTKRPNTQRPTPVYIQPLRPLVP